MIEWHQCFYGFGPEYWSWRIRSWSTNNISPLTYLSSLQYCAHKGVIVWKYKTFRENFLIMNIFFNEDSSIEDTGLWSIWARFRRRGRWSTVWSETRFDPQWYRQHCIQLLFFPCSCPSTKFHVSTTSLIQQSHRWERRQTDYRPNNSTVHRLVQNLVERRSVLESVWTGVGMWY